MSQFLKGVELPQENGGNNYGYFIPNLTGNGAPTDSTEGAVGSQYMDTTNGNIYVCMAIVDGKYVWKYVCDNVYNITSIDTIYTSIENLPPKAENGTQYVVAASSTDRAIYAFDANTNTWVKKTNLKSNSLYVVLTGNKAGLYRYTMSNDVLLKVEPSILYTEQALTEEQKARARANIDAAGATVIGDIETALDSIIEIQNNLIGGDAV